MQSTATAPRPSTPTEPTVIAAWTYALVQALELRGLDGARAARSAGIDPAVFETPATRIPLRATTRLWDVAVELTGDECIGLDAARQVRPGTFHGLGVGVISSPRFIDALRRVVELGDVACDPTGVAELIEDGGTVEFRISWPSGEAVRPCPTSVEAVLASIVGAGRFIRGGDLSPLRVELVRQAKPRSDRFEAFFGCPVIYGSDRYSLVFDHHSASSSVPSGCEDVARTADGVAQRYLDSIRTVRTVGDQVREIVREVLGHADPTAAVVAEHLAMSPRTLQRRLRAEGTSLRHLVGDVRVTVAKDEIDRGERSASRLAARLGFSDARAFRRSFKQRTGMTPAEYAAHHGASGA